MVHSGCILDDANKSFDLLEQAIWHRGNPGRLFHCGYRGEHISIRYIETFAEADIQASINIVGDSYYNAMA